MPLRQSFLQTDQNVFDIDGLIPHIEILLPADIFLVRQTIHPALFYPSATRPPCHHNLPVLFWHKMYQGFRESPNWLPIFLIQNFYSWWMLRDGLLKMRQVQLVT